MHMIKFIIVHHVTIIETLSNFVLEPEHVIITRCRCKFCNNLFSTFYSICLIVMYWYSLFFSSYQAEPNWSAIFSNIQKMFVVWYCHKEVISNVVFSFWVFGILDILTVNKITVAIIYEPGNHPCLIFLWNAFVYFFWLFNFVCSTLKHSIVTTVDSYLALFEINEVSPGCLSLLQHTNVKSSYKNKMNVNMNIRTYDELGM